MSTNKICPLKLLTPTESNYCDKNCAWWIEKTGCAIRVIANGQFSIEIVS